MFSNNNSNITKKMANASIKASKSRNIFVVFAIILATSMIIAVALYFIGARQQAKNDALDRYQAALIEVDEKAIQDLKTNENIDSVGITYFIDTINIEDYKITTMYMDDDIMRLNKYPELEGHLPKSQNEIVVAANYLTHIKSSAEIGDTISLTIRGNTSKYTISGILPLEDSSRTFSILVSKDLVLSLDSNPVYSAYFRLKGSDNMTSDDLKAKISLIASETGINQNNIVFSSYYFALIEQNTTQDINVIIGACTLVALACALVIYNLFYISVIGKTNEYGRLRIIGTTPKQIKKIVLCESLYLSSIAIPVGVVLGAVIGYILAPGGWNIFITISVALITSFIIYLMIILATRKPVQLAAKITPLEALRHVSYVNSSKATVTKKLRRSITPFRLALINLARNKKKAALTILSLGVCGILFMSSSAYLNSIDFESMAKKDFPYGDIKIELGNEGPESYNSKDYFKIQKENSLNDKFLNSIQSIDGAESIKEYSGIVIDTTIPSGYTDPFTIDGYRKNDFDLLKSNLLEGTVDYATLTNNNGIVISNMSEWKDIYGWDIQLNDKIYVKDLSGNTTELTVMGIIDSTIRYGGYNILFVPDIMLPKLQAEISDFTYQIVVAARNGQADSVEEDLYDLISTNPDLSITTLKDSAAVYKSSLDNQKAPIYILTVFIGIFGIVNLLNTLITNVLVRKIELSVFQTLGLSSKQLSKMLLIEGLAYSFGTILITLTLGTGCGYLLCTIFNIIGVFGTVTYHFPLFAIVIYFAVLLSLQITFSFISIKSFQRHPLIERIKGI